LLSLRPTLFGGWDPQNVGTGGTILDKVHQLHLSTMEWTTLGSSIPDGPTSRHIALTLPSGNEALVHNHRCTDHVLIFKDGTFRKQPTTGMSPSSRGLHAATILNNSNMILFGGAAQNGQMSNEVFVLNLHKWKWTRIDVDVDQNSPFPTPRAAPCLTSVSDNCVIMFGGAEATEQGLNPRADLWALTFDNDNNDDVNDDETNDTGISKASWSLLLDDESGPPPRNAATLSEIDPPPIDMIPKSTHTTSRSTDDNDNADTDHDNSFIKKYFVLQGGWAPFRKTWSETTLLCVEVIGEEE
jgi:hypothetical protein